MITRVLCIFARLDCGGAETMCMNLYRNIDRLKIQFDFIKHTDDSCAYDDEILSLGGKVFSAPKYKIYNHIAYIIWWSRFFKLHPEYKIVHAHYFTVASVFFRIAKKYGLTTIAHSHTANPYRKNLLEKVKDCFAMRVSKYSDYCFACGKEAGEWLFPKRDFKIIRNAIDTSKYKYDASIRKEIRQELNLENYFVIGTVGRITESKNPYIIVDIFYEFHQVDKHSKFVWCGSGDLAEEVKRKVKQLGLDDSFVFLGVRSDVNRILQAMDVFVMPSLFEGLPVAAVEAQASGLPCVFSSEVSKETDLTGNCVFLPLDNNKKWSEVIYGLSSFKRTTDCSKIINAGYDIKQTAKWLQEFYLSLS